MDKQEQRQGDDELTDSANQQPEETLALDLTKDDAGKMLILLDSAMAQAVTGMNMMKKKIAICPDKQKPAIRAQMRAFQDLGDFAREKYLLVQDIYKELDVPKKPGLIIAPNG